MTDVLSRMIDRASGSAPVVSSAVTPRRVPPQGAPGLLVESSRGDAVPAAAALPIVESARDASPAFPAPTAIEDGAPIAARGPGSDRPATPAVREAEPQRPATPAVREAEPQRPATPAVREAEPQRPATPAVREADPQRPATPAARAAASERLVMSAMLATPVTQAPVDAARLLETPRVSPPGPSAALETQRPHAASPAAAPSVAALNRAVPTRVEAAAAERVAPQPASPWTPPASPPAPASAHPAGSLPPAIRATEVVVPAPAAAAPEDRDRTRDRVAPPASAGPTTEPERVETQRSHAPPGDVRALEVIQPRAPARAPRPQQGDASDPVASEDAPPTARPRASRSIAAAPRVDLREALAAVGRALAQPPPQPPESSDEIHVTIGHVDVRAAPPAAAPPARPQPSITLAEYMRRPPGSPR
jgi:hypothetical protein